MGKKKILSCLLFCFTAFLLLSCEKARVISKTHIELPEEIRQRLLSSTSVSLEDAQTSLIDFLSTFEETSTKGAFPKAIKEAYTLNRKTLTKSSDDEDIPLVHVFNFDENKGFALVSTDTRMQPILCITDKGRFEPDSIYDGSILDIVMSEIDNYRDSYIRGGIPPFPPGDTTITDFDNPPAVDTLGNLISDPTDTVQHYVYGPWETKKTAGSILPTHWDQLTPFNKYCPLQSDGIQHCPTGCVPVAVGQIMCYWGVDYTYNNTAYSWEFMRHIMKAEDIYDIYIDENGIAVSCIGNGNMVASLLRDLGLKQNLDSYYTDTFTSTNEKNVSRTFKNFGYSHTGVRSQLDADELFDALYDGPVYGGGDHTPTIGHAWVYDRMVKQSRRFTEYSREGSVVRTYLEHQQLVHINWGWGGDYDGYYFTFRLYPGLAVTKVDPGFGYYKYNLTMITGIRP